MRSRRSRNPFYVFLVVIGTIFAVTAVAYGVMAVVDVRASAALGNGAAHPLLDWLRQHGDTTLLAELAVLAVLTVAAIGTDSYWDKQAKRT